MEKHETIERGANDLDASDLSVARAHMRFLERKHAKRDGELASAAAFTDTSSKRTLIEKLDTAIAYNILGVHIDAKRAALLSRLFTGLRRVAGRGLLSGEFSDDYAFNAAARETGVPDAFVNTLKQDVRDRMILLAK